MTGLSESAASRRQSSWGTDKARHQSIEAEAIPAEVIARLTVRNERA
jgi:hypothetical protein